MKKNLIIVCLLLFCFTVPASAAQKNVEVIKGDTIQLSVGKSKKISFKKLVKNGGTVKVKVSDKKIVKLEKKKTSVVVTGKRSGTAKLTITSGKKQYTCKIKVKKKTDNKKIALSDTDVIMHVGEEKEIQVLNYDRIIAEYEDKSLQFDIDNANVIKFGKVKEGTAVIKAVGKGESILTIKTSKEVFTCNVTVN